MTPNMLPTGMGYVITYEENGNEVVRFEVEDVERVPWGLGATITVRTRIVNARTLGNGFLTQERVSLLNSKSRRDLSERLKMLVPPPSGSKPIEWERLVEEVVYLILEAEKRPLDVLDLSTVTPNDVDHYLVPGLLPIGKTTILYGRGGGGKSAFAAGLSAAMQTGVSFCGLPVEQANVLYLDWETEAGDLADRVARASKGIGLRQAAPVKYINLAQPLMHVMAGIATVVAEHDIGCVVIDSVGMATAGGRDGGDMAEGAIEFFRALRALKTSVLAIDHISSDDLKKSKGSSKPFGSVFKVNSARNTFELVPQPDDQGRHRVSVMHRKTNTGPLLDDLNLIVEWEPDLIRFNVDRGYVISTKALEDRIMDVLATGPTSPRGLTDLVNEDDGERVTEREVREAIIRLRSGGHVNSDPSTGVVRLPKENNDGPTEQPTLPLDE